MLRALGMDDDDFSKPQIGIANSYNRITPCNMSLRDVAVSVAQGVEAGGWLPDGVRDDHGVGRDLDGPRGNALLPREPRGDRGAQ